MNFFFDSYAIIELLGQNQSYEKFAEQVVVTSALNIAEVYYILADKYNETLADNLIDNLNVTLLDFNKQIAIEASKFRLINRKKKMSYADCLGYIVSKKHGLKFLTGDDAFKDLENVEFVK